MLLKETSLHPANHSFPSAVHCRSPEGQDHSQEKRGVTYSWEFHHIYGGQRIQWMEEPGGLKESDTTEATEHTHTLTAYKLNNRGDKV